MPNNHCRYQDVHKLSLVYQLINFRFDLMVGSPCKLYWVLSCVCYTLGLVATFISLYLMNAAQPVSIGFEINVLKQLSLKVPEFKFESECFFLFVFVFMHYCLQT